MGQPCDDPSVCRKLQFLLVVRTGSVQLPYSPGRSGTGLLSTAVREYIIGAPIFNLAHSEHPWEYFRTVESALEPRTNSSMSGISASNHRRLTMV